MNIELFQKSTGFWTVSRRPVSVGSTYGVLLCGIVIKLLCLTFRINFLLFG